MMIFYDWWCIYIGHISPQHIECIKILLAAGASVVTPENYQRVGHITT
jgi:hypothetical protein